MNPGRWIPELVQLSIPWSVVKRALDQGSKELGKIRPLPPSLFVDWSSSLGFHIPRQDGNRHPLPPWLVEKAAEVTDVEIPLNQQGWVAEYVLFLS